MLRRFNNKNLEYEYGGFTKNHITGITGEVDSLILLQNGFLVSGSSKVMNIWNTNDGSLIRTFNGNNGVVHSLSVLENGYLASGSDDNTVRIWNTVDRV